MAWLWLGIRSHGLAISVSFHDAAGVTKLQKTRSAKHILNDNKNNSPFNDSKNEDLDNAQERSSSNTVANHMRVSFTVRKYP